MNTVRLQKERWIILRRYITARMDFAYLSKYPKYGYLFIHLKFACFIQKIKGNKFSFFLIFFFIHRMNLKSFTREQIAERIADHGDALLIYQNGVYRVNNWMKYHPGGEMIIQHMIGKVRAAS